MSLSQVTYHQQANVKYHHIKTYRLTAWDPKVRIIETYQILKYLNIVCCKTKVMANI